MSTIQEKITHTANLAKWKLDQQFRLNNSQTMEKQLQSQIIALKIDLGNETFNLFNKGKIIEENLIKICQTLAEIEKQLQTQIQQTKIIKNEQPPSIEAISGVSMHLLPNTSSSSNLICPKCKKPIPVKYCPDCGQEGINLE